MRPDVQAALRQASAGLIYRSDTDAPFTPFSWGKSAGDLTPEKVAHLAGAATGATVEEGSVADFFKGLTADGVEDAEKYRRLQKVFGEQLSSARVFRIGEETIDVYLVGRTANGEWVGLKTQAVET